MKRIFLLCTFLFLLTGCSSVQNSNIDTLLADSLASNVRALNVSRNGYRYYLPRGLSIKTSDNFNDVITNNKYIFYLYVDIVSFRSKTGFSYYNNDNAYFSRVLENNDKKGYIEINNYKNNQYLIEIMYNYAKIEVVVDESDINLVVSYAISILTSITYNDSVIKNYLDNDVLDSIEENFNIFEIVGSDNYLEFTDEVDDDEDIKDPDYVD